MMAGSRNIGAALIAASVLFAGCSDGTGPGEPFDPAHAQADVALLGTLFESQQLAAFAELSTRFDLGSGTPLAAVAGARALVMGDASPSTARRIARQAAEALSLSSSSVGAPSLKSLPTEVLGTTFVFDTTSDSYVESDRTGAPATGVRFIVYALDPISGDPIVSQEVGYADLIDLSPASQTSAGLRLLLVGGGTTYLDYSLTATPTQTTVTIGVEGFLSDGTTTLDFAVDADLVFDTNEFTIDVDFAFAIPAHQFSTTGSIDATSTSTSSLAEIDLLITSGGTRIRYEIVEDDFSETINATVYVNNRIFATITGDLNDPTVAGAGGAELTTEETAALIGMGQLAVACFDFFVRLWEPAGNVLGGGLLP